MRRRGMQEVALTEVYQTRKKRAVNDRTPTKTKVHTTVKRRSLRLSQACSSDSGPEIVWDNNSPSPRKDINRGKRRAERGKDIQALIRKVGATDKPTSDVSAIKDHSLFDVWMQRGPEVKDVDLADRKVVASLSPEVSLVLPKQSRFKGKTPRRLVGHLRSKQKKIVSEFQNELNKLMMAFSEPSTDCKDSNKQTDMLHTRSVSEDELCAGIFEEDIEALEFIGLDACQEIVAAKDGKASNKVSTDRDAILTHDVLSDDDLDDVIRTETLDSSQDRNGDNLLVGNSEVLLNCKVVTNNDLRLQNAKKTCTRYDSEGYKDDFFTDEDCFLSLAIQNMEGNGTSNTLKSNEQKQDIGSKQCSKNKKELSVSYGKSKFTHITSANNTKQVIARYTVDLTVDKVTNKPAGSAVKSTNYCTRNNTCCKENEMNNKSQMCGERVNSFGLISEKFGIISQIEKTANLFVDDTSEDDAFLATIPLDEGPCCSTQKYSEAQIQEKRRKALEKLSNRKRKGGNCNTETLTRETRQR